MRSSLKKQQAIDFFEVLSFSHWTNFMPNIFRFLVVCAVIGGIGYAALYTLATAFEPSPRDISVVVPPSRYAK
jgi:hypothetical protein